MIQTIEMLTHRDFIFGNIYNCNCVAFDNSCQLMANALFFWSKMCVWGKQPDSVLDKWGKYGSNKTYWLFPSFRLITAWRRIELHVRLSWYVVRLCQFYVQLSLSFYCKVNLAHSCFRLTHWRPWIIWKPFLPWLWPSGLAHKCSVNVGWLWPPDTRTLRFPAKYGVKKKQLSHPRVLPECNWISRSHRNSDTCD